MWGISALRAQLYKTCKLERSQDNRTRNTWAKTCRFERRENHKSHYPHGWAGQGTRTPRLVLLNSPRLHSERGGGRLRKKKMRVQCWTVVWPEQHFPPGRRSGKLMLMSGGSHTVPCCMCARVCCKAKTEINHSSGTGPPMTYKEL